MTISPEDYLGEATTVTRVAVDHWAAAPALPTTPVPVAELATRTRTPQSTPKGTRS
nr:hypothetical protein GCM10025730_15270 [Promicromonospora thailandica]